MTNTYNIMRLSCELEKELLGERGGKFRHISDMPWLSLPEGFAFKVIFPFAGAAARFRVCKTSNPEKDVSVYLDTKHVLGLFGRFDKSEPYWEAYSIDGDTARFALSEGQEMIDAIVKELSSNKSGAGE